MGFTKKIDSGLRGGTEVFLFVFVFASETFVILTAGEKTFPPTDKNDETLFFSNFSASVLSDHYLIF